MDRRTDRHDDSGRRFSLGFSHISSYSCELNSIFHCSAFMHYKTLHVKRGKVTVKQQAVLVSRIVRLTLYAYFHQFYFCSATSQGHDKDPTMLQTTSWVEQRRKDLVLTIILNAVKGWHSELLRSWADPCGSMDFSLWQAIVVCNTLKVCVVTSTKIILLNDLISEILF